jgi:hypothetical protein
MDCIRCGYHHTFALVYRQPEDVGTDRWVRRFDYSRCDAESEAHQFVLNLREHGYPRAVWNEA